MPNDTRVLAIHSAAEVARELTAIGVDASGIDIMTAKAVFRVVKVDGVPARAANIIKQEMLARGGDAAVSRGVYEMAGEQTGVILMGTLRQYETLVAKLSRQPFGLKGVAKGITAALASFDAAPSRLIWRDYDLDLASHTHLMGVLNVTPDSFSDAGRFADAATAIEHGRRMAAEGADIIDVGGESSRPGAEPVAEDEELRRVIPVIKALASRTKVPVSVDTYKSGVARRALEAGAAIVNDISGLRMDGAMPSLVASAGVPVVIMHMQGTPRDMQRRPRYEDLLGEISAWLAGQAGVAVSAGVKPEHVIVDPGIGFGKTFDHNLEIIRRLRELKSLGYPVAIGPSRKAFIGAILDAEVDERLEGTAATVAYCISQGANIVRVHDVKEMRKVARVTDAIKRGAVG